VEWIPDGFIIRCRIIWYVPIDGSAKLWVCPSIDAVNIVVPGAAAEVAITVGAVEGVMTAGSFGPMTVPSRIDQTGLIWRIVISMM